MLISGIASLYLSKSLIFFAFKSWGLRHSWIHGTLGSMAHLDPWATWHNWIRGQNRIFFWNGNGLFELILLSFELWQKKLKNHQYQEHLFVFLSKSGTLKDLFKNLFPFQKKKNLFWLGIQLYQVYSSGVQLHFSLMRQLK